MRILIADREPEFVTMLSTTLQDLGFEVLVAYDGEQAVALYNSHFPQVVVTEYLIPKLNGMDLLRIAKRKNIQPYCIMMSHLPKEAKNCFKDPQIDLYLEKPFVLLNLVRAIQSLKSLRKTKIA